MKKIFKIAVLVSSLFFANSCKHQNLNMIKSDDISSLWGKRPADIDIKIMGYNISVDNKFSFGILDVIDNTEKSKRRSIVLEKKLFIDGQQIKSSQNSPDLNPFLENIFKNRKCLVSCNNINDEGYENFSREIQMVQPITKKNIFPKNIKGNRLPVTVKWNPCNTQDNDVLISVYFAPVASNPNESGTGFTWNKITSDDGEFIIPAEIYSKVNYGYVDVVIYRGNNTNFVDKNNKLISISSVFKASSGFFVNQ